MVAITLYRIMSVPIAMVFAKPTLIMLVLAIAIFARIGGIAAGAPAPNAYFPLCSLKGLDLPSCTFFSAMQQVFRLPMVVSGFHGNLFKLPRRYWRRIRARRMTRLASSTQSFHSRPLRRNPSLNGLSWFLRKAYGVITTWMSKRWPKVWGGGEDFPRVLTLGPDMHVYQ